MVGQGPPYTIFRILFPPQTDRTDPTDQFVTTQNNAVITAAWHGGLGRLARESSLPEAFMSATAFWISERALGDSSFVLTMTLGQV